MAFSLGSFAGGISEGMETGEDLARKRREDQLARVQDRSRFAVENYLRGQQGGGPPSSGPPPPATPGAGKENLGGQPGGGMPQPLAMPGARPMPSAVGGPAPSGAGMVAAPPGPGGGAPGANTPPPPKPPMAAPAPQGGMNPGKPPAPQGPPEGQQGGQGGQPQDPNQQGLSLIQTLAHGIAAAQPKGYQWEHGELLDALDTMLGALKNVDPSVKLAAQTALKIQGMQLKQLEDDANREERGRESDNRNQTHLEGIAAQAQAAWKRAQLTTSSAERRTAMTDATRIAATNIIQAGENGRTAAVNQTREDIAQAGIDAREGEDAVKDQLKAQGMSDAYVAKIFATQTGGAAIGAGPKVPGRPVAQPLSRPGHTRVQGAGRGGSGTIPPEAMKHLKEGQPTTFANGQTWMLKGGKPVRVN